MDTQQPSPTESSLPNEQPQPTSLASFSSTLESRRRQRETQRSIIEIHQQSLRAAERTISLLREQIRFHDQRAQLSSSNSATSTVPDGRHPRTRAQREASERESAQRLSSRIAALREYMRWRQLSRDVEENPALLITRSEIEALSEENNSLTRNPSRSASLRLPAQQDLNGCPIPTYSIVTSAHNSYLVRESSDRWIGSRQRENTSSSSASPRRVSNQNHSGIKSASTSRQEALEREWERQLADGEVDSNGVPILKDHPKVPSFNQLPPHEPIRSHDSFGFSSTHLGTRKVDGLGLQLAMMSNHDRSNSFSTSKSPSFRPLCLR